MKIICFVLLTAIASAPAFAAKAGPALLTLQGASGIELAGIRVESPAPAPEPVILEQDAVWKVITDKIFAMGVFTPANEPLPASYGLEDIKGSFYGPHDADYINIWGHFDDGVFIPDMATMVSEKWEINEEGNWHISQWLHWLRIDGVPFRAVTHTLIETMDGQLVGYEGEELPLYDPATEANRSKLLKKWCGFIPQNK